METPVCIHCQQDSTQVPLLPVLYQDKTLHICPQHLPILIHKPALLADRLPGLEKISVPDEHQHG